MVEDCPNFLKANAKLLTSDDCVIYTAATLAGAVNYIPKPYDSEELKLSVDNTIKNIISARTPARLAINCEPIKNIALTQNVTQVCIKSRLGKTYKKLGINGKNSYEKRKRLEEVIKDYL